MIKVSLRISLFKLTLSQDLDLTSNFNKEIIERKEDKLKRTYTHAYRHAHSLTQIQSEGSQTPDRASILSRGLPRKLYF